MRDRRRPRRAQRVACALPRPSAIASAKFAKSTVSQSQNAIAADEPEAGRVARARSRKKIPVVITLPSSTMNITGFRICCRGSSFGNESLTAARTMSREKMLPLACHYGPSLSSARLSSRTLTPGSPRKPRLRPSVLSSISCSTVRAELADAAMRAPGAGVRRRDVRVDAGARGRDRVDRDVADREARVVRALELQDRRAAALTFFARSGFVGPRLANVVAPAL